MMRCYQCLHWYLGKCDHLSKGVSPDNAACKNFIVHYCQKNIDTVEEWELWSATEASKYLDEKGRLSDRELEWALGLSGVIYSAEKFLHGARPCDECRRKDCLRRDVRSSGGDTNNPEPETVKY